MCQALKKNCKFCNKKLAYNNKIGFCFDCVPKKDVIKLFEQGKTISEISENIFYSNCGYYRGFIRKILKEHFKLGFLDRIKRNKSNYIIKNNREKLPLQLIKDLHNQGKLTTQIHKVLLEKGYVLHIATLRKVLSGLNLDYNRNYKNWLTCRSKTSKKKKKLINDLWVNGNSIKKISKIIGLSELTIATYLRGMGVKTRLLQYYYSEVINKEEEIARSYLENKGFELKRCLFLCQRKFEKSFDEILLDDKIPFPKELKKFCKDCPIKDLNFEEQELYDFISKKGKEYSVVEVKKIYNDPYRRAHFSLGQFLNLPKIIKAEIGFKLIIFDRGKIYEKKF